MEKCKCTESINCNPCTNDVRFSDLCPECFLHGHAKMQSKTVTKINVALEVKK